MVFKLSNVVYIINTYEKRRVMKMKEKKLFKNITDRDFNKLVSSKNVERAVMVRITKFQIRLSEIKTSHKYARFLLYQRPELVIKQNGQNEMNDLTSIEGYDILFMVSND